MNAYFDTNVVIPALVRGQPNFRTSVALLRRASEGDMQGFLSAQGLTEVYSVLTRAPWVSPVSPAEALLMIEQTLRRSLTIIDVRADAYFAAIAVCGRQGWRGGRIHDAVHVQAAAQAGCDVIYTYDVAHFRSVAGDWTGRIEEPPAV